MIKNESKIIERCLSHALEYVDAFCILDTGSTDNSVELCTTFLESCGKPYRISVEPFQNFGYNRTVSFKKAQELCYELGWDLNKTYAMVIDADMIIKPSIAFKDFQLTATGYNVIQQTGALKYYNRRFLKCSYDWKCIGVTHEYWSGEGVEKIPYDVIYIEDMDDGGCKTDKFDRDIKLLLGDLKTDPHNVRTHFYLAQSYKDSGNFKEAITFYLKRIELGGWYEEIWYSHYQIAKCFEFLKQPEDMEYWMLKAFKYNPRRAEPLYHLVKHFKDKYEHFKAYQYYLKGRHIPFPKNESLFIEYGIYDGLFEYENTILSCYIFSKTKQDTLENIINYINTYTYHLENVWDNLQYYIEPLVSITYKGTYSKFIFPLFDEYCVSSCSILPYKNEQMLMNTRLVNYSIDDCGAYHIRSSDGHVRTKNGFTFLNTGNLIVIQDITLMKEDIDKVYPSNIEGLEDIRLFQVGDKIKFSASSKNLTNDGKIHIAIGDYCVESHTIKNISVILPPRSSDCEKNWIYVPESAIEGKKSQMNFIYSWYPLEIGAVDSGKLTIHTRYNTPPFFSRIRGSSTLCEWNNRLLCVVHFVKYSTPRLYFHSIVSFKKYTMKPESYSLPFVFRKCAIEYCLGFHIRDDGIACFIFSQNDCDPGIIQIPLSNLRFLNHTI